MAGADLARGRRGPRAPSAHVGAGLACRQAARNATLARIAAQFPGALIALDTYPKQTFDWQHRLAAKKDLDARWAWSCDDPRSLERFGLEVMESASITRPPRAMRSQLPARYRYLMPLADPVLGKTMAITLFRASSPGAAG